MAYINGQEVLFSAQFNGIVEATGQKTENGSVLFNDTENNKAVADLSFAAGKNTSTGICGYSTLGATINGNQATVVFNADTNGKYPNEIWSVGDVLNFDGGFHLYKRFKVVSLADDGIVIEDVGDPGNFIYKGVLDDKSEISLVGTDEEKYYFSNEKYPFDGDPIPQRHSGTVFGEDNKSEGCSSFSAGRNNVSMGDYGGSIGRNNVAGYCAFVTGRNSGASGEYSFAGGHYSKATNLVGFSFGQGAISSGKVATAFGENTNASGVNAFAISEETEASGRNAFAQGYQTKAKGLNCSAFGVYSEASGDNSAAFGFKTIASGENTATFGVNTVASGKGAAAFGSSNKATGSYATVFGDNNTAEGARTVVFGGSCKATKSNALAGGYKNEANGTNSAAFGYITKASHDQQFVCGWDNADKETSIFEVGCGGKKNAFEVNKNGTAAVLKDPINPMDLATKQYVDALKTRISELEATVSSFEHRITELESYMWSQQQVTEE